MFPVRIWLLLLLALCGCDGSRPPHAPPEPTRSLLLARHPQQFVSVSVPGSSRPLPLSAAVPVRGPWRSDWREEGVVQWSIPLPVRGIDFGFGRSRAPEEVRLEDPSGRKRRWDYAREVGEGRVYTWDVSRERLRIRLPEGRPPPEDWTLQVPRLESLEKSLQHDETGGPADAFVSRSLLIDEQTHTGLFLPAPAELTVALPSDTLGPAARLRTTVRLLPPFLGSPTLSDGASAAIHLRQGEATTLLWSGAVDAGDAIPLDLPLPPGTGDAQLEVSTTPGAAGDATVDYVFFDEPTVFTPTQRPRRVLVVLIDTLRADRLSAYGYSRPTSPVIDALAARGTRFDNAHAPSPWTLPSTRSVLSGQPPESWRPLDHIGSRLAAEGFATALISGNTYISRYVDMHRGWSLHTYRLFSGADRQLGIMEDFLAQNPDRDAFVVLQLMEPHLPYHEPEHLRNLWAGATPPGLSDAFNVKDVRRWDTRGLLDADARTWVSDRYDQNVRAADEAVGRALELMGEDALVVVTADHGEELWDHGDFEHGHALWEELVRVPLVVAGPGLPQAEVDAPVSLADVVPTLLGQLQVDASGTTGQDLRGAMAGEPEALATLTARPLAFRDLLYRSDAVGVLVDGHRKWTAREGAEQVFDLSTDPGEKTPIDAELSVFHRALSQSLEREVVQGWRLALPGVGVPGGGRRARMRADITLTHPDGLKAAFAAFDSRARTDVQATLTQTGVQLSQMPGIAMPTEIFVVPAEPRTDPAPPALSVRQGSRVWSDPPASPAPESPALRQAGPPSAPVFLTPAVFPLPSTHSGGQVVIDAEAEAGLRALGYLE